MLNVIERLNQEHFSPAVCVSRKGGELDRVVEQLQIPFLEAPSTVAPKPYLTLPLRAWKTARTFRQYRFALWHSFNYSDDYTEPLVAHFLRHEPWMPTKKNMGWGSRAWRVRSQLAKGIATQNTTMIKDFFPRQTRKVRHIPPGVDLELFQPGPPDMTLRRTWGFPPGTLLLGHVAQIMPHQKPGPSFCNPWRG